MEKITWNNGMVGIRSRKNRDYNDKAQSSNKYQMAKLPGEIALTFHGAGKVQMNDK